MTEVKDRTISRIVGGIIKFKFEEFSPNCPDRIVDSNGGVACCYHDSSATDCRFGICPRMETPLDESARILEREEPKRR